ncbi:thioredoxin domain-containing protein [Candidatus Kaiserbacteria bacterium]|nr:thioredoxin domain-containing protein [Candidatus Kaiserbacteria bacterium]
MKNPWFVIGVIVVVLFGGAILLSNSSTKDSNAGVEIIQHITGNPESEVKLVEYSDFQCPACGAFHPVVKQLLSEYGDRISFEYKSFPLSNIHPNALSAAMAAEAAGQQDKFFEFHDLLFDNQSEWSAVSVPTTFFLQYAEEIGLDIEQFKKQMKSTLLRDKVKADFDEGRELGVTGTPSFFLNGNKMEFDSYPGFVEQVVIAVDPTLLNSSSTDSALPQNSQPEVKFGI